MVGSRLKKISNIILFCLAFQNFSHLYSQRLLKNEIVHLKVSENRISKDSAAVAVLDIDMERMEFEKNIDILFQKKEYYNVIEQLLAWNSHDSDKMGQAHLSDLGYAYYRLAQYDSTIFYLKASEEKGQYSVNDYHHAILGSSYFNSGLKNQGCFYMSKAMHLFDNRQGVMNECLLPTVTKMVFPKDSCRLKTRIKLKDGQIFNLHSSQTGNSYGKIGGEETEYSFRNYKDNVKYVAKTGDAEKTLVLHKSDVACEQPGRRFKQYVWIETFSEDNKLADWSGLHTSSNGDSLWLKLDSQESDYRKKTEPDTLRAKWTLSGNGRFTLSPKLEVKLKDRVTVYSEGEIGLDNVEEKLTVEGYGTYRTHGSHMSSELIDSLNLFKRNHAYGLGSVIHATSNHPDGLGGLSQSGKTFFNSKSSGEFSMFINMKNVKNNSGLFKGEIVVHRKKPYEALKDAGKRQYHLSELQFLLSSVEGEKKLKNLVSKYSHIAMEVKGNLITANGISIPPTGLTAIDFDEDKLVPHVNYGAIMYKIGEEGIWKGIAESNNTIYLTSHTSGRMEVAVNSVDYKKLKGDFQVKMRIARHAY